MSSTTASVRRVTALVAAAAISMSAAALTAATPAHATGVTPDVAYSSIPATLPPNVVSQGFAAENTAELGDLVELASGTGRELDAVEIGFSSWACETGAWQHSDCVTTPGSGYTHPITVTLYEVGAAGAVGAEIASVTKSVTVPFRPSYDPVNCASGRWWDSSTGSCSNGLLFTQVFPFASEDVTLPDSVIVGVSYPTSDTPGAGLAAGGSYDALNVALDGDVTAGTDVDADVVYISSVSAGSVGAFAAEAGWGAYASAMITITTTTAAVVAPPKPTSTPPVPATSSAALAVSQMPLPSSVLGTTPTGGFAPGSTVTFNIGAPNGNTWLYGSYFSSPTAVGWVYVSPSGNVTLPLPSTLPAGTHTIVLVDASGNVVATVAGVSVAALLAATGPDPVEVTTLALTGATFLLAGLVLLNLRRRSAARA